MTANVPVHQQGLALLGLASCICAVVGALYVGYGTWKWLPLLTLAVADGGALAWWVPTAGEDA